MTDDNPAAEFRCIAHARDYGRHFADPVPMAVTRAGQSGRPCAAIALLAGPSAGEQNRCEIANEATEKRARF